MPIPLIAAGDNLAIPVIGSLFRRSGAFFIRRNVGAATSDVAIAYKGVLKAYMREACLAHARLNSSSKADGAELVKSGGRSLVCWHLSSASRRRVFLSFPWLSIMRGLRRVPFTPNSCSAKQKRTSNSSWASFRDGALDMEITAEQILSLEFTGPCTSVSGKHFCSRTTRSSAAITA